MESERVFRCPYRRWIVAVFAAWAAVLVAVGCAQLRPWDWRPTSAMGLVIQLSPLCALILPLMAHAKQRRECRHTWVRLRPGGLTVSNLGHAVDEVEWADIASITPDISSGGLFWGLSISTHDGRTIEVDNGIERGDELCQAIWATGRFVSTGGDSETRWVPKQPEPLPAPEAGSS